MEKKSFFQVYIHWQIQEKNPNFINARELLTSPRHYQSLSCVDLATGSLKISSHKDTYSFFFSCPLMFIPNPFIRYHTSNSVIFYIFYNTLIIFISITAFLKGWAVENKRELLHLTIGPTNTLRQGSSIMGSSIWKLFINKICPWLHPSLAAYHTKRCIISSISAV